MDKDEKRIKLSVIEDKNKVILKIKDNGCGIKESDISRVFDKGFTGSNRKKEHWDYTYVRNYVIGYT